jgi:hypothetical protein
MEPTIAVAEEQEQFENPEGRKRLSLQAVTRGLVKTQQIDKIWCVQ